MNFVRRSCLLSFGRAPLWNNSCCKDIYKSTQLIDFNDERKVFSNPTPSRITLNRRCPGYLHNIPSLILWSQVRFQRDGCPPLHRDLEFPNFDPYRKDSYKDVRKTDWGAGDGKPGYTYVVGFFGLLSATYATKTVLIHFASYMSAAADVLALASIEVDISKIEPGACGSFKWRGKPLFIKHRTEADIELESNTPLTLLRDPQTSEQRCIKAEWLVVIGICTHLGCVPIPNSGDYPGGFYCPCHGSHYDNVGRARKGPAPTNLEVPPYKFVEDTLLLVG